MLIVYKKPTRGRFFIVGGMPVVEWTVTVTAGSNGSVSVDGVTGDYSATVPDGTVLTLEATASEHYAFTQWSDGNTDNPRTITVTSDIALSSENDPLSYSVSVYSNGNGSVSVDGTPGDYSDYCSYGTVLTLEATPDTDYDFDSWTDGDNTNPRTLTVDDDISLGASFQEVVPPVVEWNVSVYSNGNGSVSVDGVTGDYSAMVIDGTVLVLEATADQSYEFDSWSDGDSTNPRTLTVDSDVSLGATFQAQVQYYSVSVIAGSNGSVSVNGVSGNYSDSVASGTTLTLAATADSGYDFDQWSDGSSSNPRSLTVTSNVTLTASFQAQPQPGTQPNDEIWYTSTDDNIVTPSDPTAFGGATITSNTYSIGEGKGIIKFDQDITTVGVSAFNNCATLRSVILPDSLTSIDNRAFQNCQSLDTVSAGTGLASIGQSSFRDDIILTTIRLKSVPTTVTDPSSRASFRNVALSGTVFGQPGLDFTMFMTALPMNWSLIQ